MKNHERIFKTYKRNHKGQYFEDTEKAKIQKEKEQIKKLEKRAKNLINRTSLLSDDEEMTNEIETVYYEIKKVAGNRNSHKSRFKKLQKNDDFV